jgi:hypothetical protein
MWRLETIGRAGEGDFRPPGARPSGRQACGRIPEPRAALSGTERDRRPL